MHSASWGAGEATGTRAALGGGTGRLKRVALTTALLSTVWSAPVAAQLSGQGPVPAAAPAPASAGVQAVPPRWPADAQGSARAPADAQLQAIRDALIEKAMGANTRVSATSWVNERGELMEASQFRTDMQVRGVRVLEYMGDQEPKAVVDVASASQAQARVAQPVCRDPSGAELWRHPMSLRVQAVASPDPQVGLLTAQAARWVDSTLRQLAQADGAVWDTAPVLPARNRYEEALWSAPQPRSPLALQVRVRVVQGWESSVPGARRVQWESRAREWMGWAEPGRQAMTLQLEWTLARSGEAPILQQVSHLPLVAEALVRPSRQWSDEARVRLQGELAHRWQVLQGTLDCEPLVYEARSQGDGQVMLMAGHDAGLRPGDRLVLVDARHVPRRLLEPESAAHLALLEVQQVQGQRAQARQVAGPRMSVDSAQHWLAMPYGASLLAARQEAVK